MKIDLKPVAAGAAMTLALALGAADANANVTYVYTGAPFTIASGGWSGSNNVTGSMVLSAALNANLNLQVVAPVSFSFSDGLDTFTSLNAVSPTIFAFSTDSSGNITGWNNFYQIDGSHYIQSSGNGDAVLSPSGGAFNSTKGSWSLATAVPEPASWALLLIGFGIAGGGLRMTRRKTEKTLILA